MASQDIKIQGQILNKNQKPLPKLRIEAWSKILRLENLVGEGKSDKDGNFQITFTQERYKELFLGRDPDLYFKIYDGDRLILSTENTVVWNRRDGRNELKIILDLENGEPGTTDRKIRFSGMVKHSNGNAIAKMKVLLSEQMLRNKERLAETSTDGKGFYTIEINVRPENTAYLLEAIDDQGNPLAASPLIFKPQENGIQNLTITDERYKGASTFLLRQPVLTTYVEQLNAAPDRKPLTVEDVYFVADQTGEDPRDAFQWIRAKELETATAIPAEAFYGIFKQGLPTHPNALSLKSGQEIKDAIVQAAAASYVSDELAAKADKMVKQWNAYIVNQALEEVPQKMDASLNQVLKVALPNKSMQAKVLTAYLTHEGALGEFWKKLPQVTGDETSAEKIQTALKLGVLTGNQPDVMEALVSSNGPSANLLPNLAAMDAGEWTALVKELSVRKNKSVVPTFIEAENENQRVEIYATQMANMLEESFPTQAFFGKLAKQNPAQSPFTANRELVKFFQNNPSFDLKETATISLLDEDAPFNFSGIQDKKSVARELQSIQRLSAYTTNFQAMTVLKTNGMDAAYNIVNIPQNKFIQTYLPTFGSVEATQLVYQQAEKNYMYSVMLWAEAHPNLTFKTTTTPAPLADPTLRTMFGTLDACECEHCTSVFSPAAYYTDILNFLYSRTPAVYNELIRRRPDLIQLELTCENTNTPLPYVDLVNELLENFILTHMSPPVAVPAAYQTTWQARELAANPEHLNYTAYDALKTAVYPRVLPFNLPVEEARVYLKHLGVQKHQLMTTFFAGTPEAAFADFSINMERLNLSPQEAQILSGEITGDGSTNSGLWNFYGFNKATGYKALTDPADSSQQIAGGQWSAALTGRVDVFLQQTGLIYKELLTLLLCHSINPVTGTDGSGQEIRAINIVSIDGDNASCELDNLKLTGVTTAHLQKIHRFLRAWRRLGWSLYDLDRAAVAFSLDFGNNIVQNKNKLNQLSQTAFLAKQLRLPVENLLALWSNISTAVYHDYFQDNYPPIASLYEKLFSNKAVLNPIDPAFADPTALAGVIDDHTATLVAALQISDEDYGYLKGELPDNNLTLANLSDLYRNTLLAKKLKLKVKDFLALKKLIGTSGDAFSAPLSTFAFLQKADTVKSSGFSIDHLNYLLRHDFLEETGVAPGDDDLGVFLSELRRSLRTIEYATGEEQRNTIVQKFSEKLKITATASGLLLLTHVKGITDNTKAVVEDFRADDFTTFPFLQTYTDVGGKDFEPQLVRANPSADPGKVAVPDLFDDYLRLEKIAAVINKLKWSDTDLENILVYQATLQCTDLSQLPVALSAGDFTQFETLVNLIKARDTMPIGTPDFFDILLQAITAPDKTRWLDDLVTRTNWDRATLEALVGDGTTTANAGIFRTNFPADFIKGELILRVKDGLRTLNKIGLRTALIEAAIAPDFNHTVSDSIKNAAKAKYDEDQWLKLAKPLRDDLREKQREALVAYVVVHANFNPAQSKFERWKNSDELYEYLLIDVEMKPISMTSRLKQAICSVQLFIDRVLMNLEHPNSNPAVSPLKLEGDQVEEWNHWRRIYRVWEANRKIFLYPENWLEPELRDDKSPFFAGLETQLKQNELNEENVEDAFHAYLDKLDEVARLEVVGLYHQIETDLPDEDNIDILHVFARTYAHPHQYFHRTLENGEWTAWQKLEIDVDGNHIVPVIFNRKLCLLWLFFTQETEENTSLNPNASSISSPLRWWKIQAAWSEYRKNKWTAKRLSNNYITSQKFTYTSSLESIRSGCWISVALANDKLYLSVGGLLYGSSQAFIFNNTNEDPSLGNAPPKPYPLDVLTHTSIHNVYATQQMFQAGTANIPFELFVEHDDIDGGIVISTENLPILRKTPEGKFKLVVPSNEYGPLYNNFFFQDAKNTFYVTHAKVKVPTFTKPDFGLHDWNKYVNANWGYFYPDTPVEDPLGPVIDEYFKYPLETLATFAINSPTGAVGGGGVSPAVGNAAGAGNMVVRNQPMAIRAAEGAFALSNSSSSIDYSAIYAEKIPLVSKGKVLVTKYKEEDRFTFATFYHAQVKTFIKALYKLGVEGLLKREVQTQNDSLAFKTTYDPGSLVYTPYPTNEVDFLYGSPYSQYNWELFFHVPMLIAVRLKDDQRFEEARTWFHYIFNPTNSEGGDKERFWQFKPFYDEAGKAIQTLNELLQNETELAKQVEKWMDNPFKPHVIARMRISAYMRNVVMKYLDNLIAWGDNLFRRDTIEAINEATNLYILAAKILGERPQQIPPRAEHDDATFDELKDELDAFSNAMVQIETMLAPSAAATEGTSSGSTSALGKMFYFCVPRNEFLMKYWDTVADRLFKIRHSMNIEGVVRTLPLFEPPIDPAMLVRAAAAGMDLSSILSDLNAALPPYRFTFMLQKANEFASEVKALGTALLQALEKRDAETMALLRSTHEQNLLEAVLRIKENQVDDAKAQLASIQKSAEIAQQKLDYYSSRPFMNNFELQQLSSVETGMILSAVQSGLSSLGGVLSVIPNLKAGAPTSMGVTWGGDNLGAMMNAVSTALGIASAINNAQGSMAGTLGSYTRRMDDWKFQADSALKEIQQLEQQVISSEIKLAIAEKEVHNQELQIGNSQEADEFMRSKFTNQQLYDWMIGQLSTVYFQSYQLAYDLAKKTEQCYQYELGEFGNTSFVQFGYWDSLKKGLLSAEKLQYDLRRMESAFYTKNVRELELTKHLSLVLFNPQAILDLRLNGTTTFVIPEAVFDLDFPGHYFRRIKSVSLSIPCIAGPYTTINATLRLLKHTTRLNTNLDGGGNYESADYGAESDRFRHVTTETHAIATSNAQNDSGVFELNFRDEKYLPFEGCGAFGEWQLELNTEKELRMFDYQTISDVILTLRYTAKADAGAFKTTVSDALKTRIQNALAPTDAASGLELKRLFSLKHEFSSNWHQFLYPAVEGADQTLGITLQREHFPFFTLDRSLAVKKMEVLVKATRTGDYKMILSGTDTGDNPMTSAEITLTENPLLANLQTATLTSSTPGFNVQSVNVFASLTSKFKHQTDANYHAIGTDPDEITEVYLVVYYELGTV